MTCWRYVVAAGGSWTACGTPLAAMRLVACRWLPRADEYAICKLSHSGSAFSGMRKCAIFHGGTLHSMSAGQETPRTNASFRDAIANLGPGLVCRAGTLPRSRGASTSCMTPWQRRRRSMRQLSRRQQRPPAAPRSSTRMPRWTSASSCPAAPSPVQPLPAELLCVSLRVPFGHELHLCHAICNTVQHTR